MTNYAGIAFVICMAVLGGAAMLTTWWAERNR